jgi:hypothetical protein
MSLPTLKIAGIEIPLEVYPVSQGYSRVDGGSSLLRKMNGAGLEQTNWSRLATKISGKGWAPVALAGVDWSAAVQIDCVQPRAIASATNSATLPTARRSDLTDNVFARAIVASRLVETPVSLAGDVATATAVTGATGYQFHYYPKLSCISRGPVEDLDLETGSYGWSLDAQEV